MHYPLKNPFHFFSSTLMILLILIFPACDDPSDPDPDKNQNQENTAPEIADQSFSIAENSPAGTAVGTVVASDADGDALTYSITSGNTDDAFTIDSSSGELTVNSSTPLVFATNPSFSLSIEATDGELSSSATVTVTLIEGEVSGIDDCKITTIEYFESDGTFEERYIINYEGDKVVSIRGEDDDEGVIESETLTFTYEGDKIVSAEYDNRDTEYAIEWDGNLLSKITGKSYSECDEDCGGFDKEYDQWSYEFTYDDGKITQYDYYYGTSAISFEDISMSLSEVEKYEYTEGNITRYTGTSYEGGEEYTWAYQWQYDAGVNPFYQNVAWFIYDGWLPYYMSQNNTTKYIDEDDPENTNTSENQYDSGGKLIRSNQGDGDKLEYAYQCE